MSRAGSTAGSARSGRAERNENINSFQAADSWQQGMKDYQGARQRTPAVNMDDFRSVRSGMQDAKQRNLRGHIGRLSDSQGAPQPPPPRRGIGHPTEAANGPVPISVKSPDMWCDTKPHTAKVSGTRTTGSEAGMFAEVQQRGGPPQVSAPPPRPGHDIITNSIRPGTEPRPMYGVHGWTRDRHAPTSRQMEAKRDVDYAAAKQRETVAYQNMSARRPQPSLVGGCQSVRAEPAPPDVKAAISSAWTRKSSVDPPPMDGLTRGRRPIRGFDIISGVDFTGPRAGQPPPPRTTAAPAAATAPPPAAAAPTPAPTPPPPTPTPPPTASTTAATA